MLSAPVTGLVEGSAPRGGAWTATLKPEWVVPPAPRSGSFTIVPDSAGTTPTSFDPSALAPSRLRSALATPQLRPRSGTNLPLRAACIAVFVLGLIWVAKIALD